MTYLMENLIQALLLSPLVIFLIVLLRYRASKKDSDTRAANFQTGVRVEQIVNSKEEGKRNAYKNR